MLAGLLRRVKPGTHLFTSVHVPDSGRFPGFTPCSYPGWAIRDRPLLRGGGKSAWSSLNKHFDLLVSHAGQQSKGQKVNVTVEL